MESRETNLTSCQSWAVHHCQCGSYTSHAIDRRWTASVQAGCRFLNQGRTCLPLYRLPVQWTGSRRLESPSTSSILRWRTCGTRTWPDSASQVGSCPCWWWRSLIHQTQIPWEPLQAARYLWTQVTQHITSEHKTLPLNTSRAARYLWTQNVTTKHKSRSTLPLNTSHAARYH